MLQLREYFKAKLDFSSVISLIALFGIFLLIPLIYVASQNSSNSIRSAPVVASEGKFASLTMNVVRDRVNPTDSFGIILVLNTDSAPVKNVDVVIDYDPESTEFTDIVPIAQSTTELKTFTPERVDLAFDREKVVADAKSTRQIRFSARADGFFKGVTQLSELKFRSLKPGTSLIAFSFEKGSIYDTNIMGLSDPVSDLLIDSSQLLSAQVNLIAY